uniref:DUF4347 domain-containing protein n=1 Tax=Synechococcus sp. UW140 TaxID=368503 RepID=UPI0010BDEFC2
MVNSTGIALSELVVADGTCPKIRELLATSQVPVLWLDSHKDPLIALRDALAERRANGTPIHTLHWVSHGAPGTLFVGKTTINTKALLQAQQQLGSWQLNTIALWSCSTGADQDFISVLEELSGAKIWASDQTLGQLKDGSRSWKLTGSNQRKATKSAPDLPIPTNQKAAWNHQLGGFRTYTPIAPSASSTRTNKETKNPWAFAALKEDGSVITWGNSDYGGDSSSVASSLSSGVSQIFSNYLSFAALKEDGSVVTWGGAPWGGDSSSVSSSLSSGVSQISSTYTDYAALKEDGSVVTWGTSSSGGDSSSVASSLSSGVSQIFASNSAFAALKEDGSVITWGASDYGGDSSGVDLSSGVSQIFSNSRAFAALKDDGSVITWGNSSHGGDSSSVSSSISSGVSQIVSAGMAFAALKDDGSVITWGDSDYGADLSGVDLSSGVSQIFSHHTAFAALKEDGSVITWGWSDSGGDSSSVASSLTSGVSQIFTTISAFAALKEDGSVITWGASDYGGDSSSVSSSLSSGVSQILGIDGAFAALKDDGSVITWGNSDYGGDSSSVASSLTSGVSKIFGSSPAFAALKDDGSVITWGAASAGGDSSSVSASLSSGVVGFANPFTNDIYDNTAPTFTSASTSTDGTKIILTYNEELSSTTAATSDFAVTTDGTANAVTSVAIYGSTVELTLANTIYKEESVTVAYSDPTDGDDANAIQDVAGNDASNLNSATGTNTSSIPAPEDLILYIQVKLNKIKALASLTLSANNLSSSQLTALTKQDISAASKLVTLDQTLDESKQQTEFNINLNLATVAPNLNLAGSNGKRSSTKKFLYYNIDDQGALSSFNYNPITRTGAR